MKKFLIVFLFNLFFFFPSSLPVEASERGLFFDFTPDKVFRPIEIILQTSGTIEWGNPPPLSLEELLYQPDSAPLDEADLIFIGYQKEDLLFFQMSELPSQQKIFSLVRKKSDQENMIATIQNYLQKYLSFHRENKIIYTSQQTGKSKLELITPDGKKRTSLLSCTDGFLERPRFSPDGRWCVFQKNDYHFQKIFRLDLLTNEMIPLTTGLYHDYSPSFSPVGGKIVFVSDREGNPAIYQMNGDGSSQKPLVTADYRLNWPAFSPDGRYLAYSEFEAGRWKIRIKDILSEQIETIDFQGNAREPAFSFEDNTIIFVGEQNGTFDLYSYHIYHQTSYRLTHDNYPKEHPSPSPDGKWIAFAGQLSGNNWDILLLEKEKGITHRLTTSVEQERYPSFSPVPIF
ncbi:MAG: hypothetical protein PWP04_1610 [Candidatus Atribacteria bacterium]|nr:hypothetical protein [Candidatus Atribacteria bacterium]